MKLTGLLLFEPGIRTSLHGTISHHIRLKISSGFNSTYLVAETYDHLSKECTIARCRPPSPKAVHPQEAPAEYW